MLLSHAIKKAIAGILLLLTTVSFAQKEELKSLPIGQRVPLTDYSMKNVDGKMMQLETAAGEKGLLVVFSCNTCPFVVGSESFEGWEKQYNELNRFANQYGVNMILVNSNEGKRGDEDSPESMQERAKEKGYTMPYLIDRDSKLADAFGARTTPHVFLLNDRMELIYTGAIDNRVDAKRTSEENYLKNALESNASGKEIVLNSTPPRGCSIKRVKK